jgi:hypothetical protein
MDIKEQIEGPEESALGPTDEVTASAERPRHTSSLSFGDCLVTISVMVYITGCGGLCLRTQMNRILRRFLLLRRSGLMSCR